MSAGRSALSFRWRSGSRVGRAGETELLAHHRVHQRDVPIARPLPDPRELDGRFVERSDLHLPHVMTAQHGRQTFHVIRVQMGQQHKRQVEKWKRKARASKKNSASPLVRR